MAQVQHDSFNDFVETVAQLRDPQTGCPWNRAQTHESLGSYLIEESYEALDAIENESSRHLKEELGDVLLQVVLHSQIAEEHNEFTIDDVCAGINEKMIRRHPHVFGDVTATNANEVSDLWEAVKLAEKEQSDANQSSDSGKASLLDDVPHYFPALLQALKISRKAASVGFEWESIEDIWEKVDEERTELNEAYQRAPKSSDGKLLMQECIASNDDKTIAKNNALVCDAEIEFGDLLFSLVNVARRMGIDPEAALRASNEKFRRRFGFMERLAHEQGQELEKLTVDELDSLWQKAKEEE